MQPETIDRLALRLSAPGAVSLTDDERAAVASALGAFALDQRTITRQARLLALSAEHNRRIGAAADRAIGAAQEHVASPPPDSGLDPRVAALAREELAAIVERRRSGHELIAGALRLARVLAGAFV